MTTALTPEEAERLAREALTSGEPEKAEALTRALLADGSGPLHIWAMLAQAVRQQGRLTEAKQIQEMLVDHSPGNLDLRFDLAEILLQLGEFERGWREYHYRYSLAHTVSLERKVQRPRWDGRRMEGKTLLIHDEQGFGDTFQFLRMLAWVKEKSGAKLVLQIAREQESFARRMTGIDQIILRGELPPAFDMHCEMMSLPMVMGLKLTDLPGAIPYLSVDRGQMQKWRRRLDKLPRPIVALVWAGRPNHTNDAKRSMTLEALAPLGAVEGCSFISIQKGPRAGDANNPPPGLSLLNLDSEIADFDDTAAILSIADLLISVDSSPIHLAGALNRPAWVMLPYLSEWRWLTEREDSPWYPSLRLFRQQSAGDWAGLVQRLAISLKGFAEETKKKNNK